MRWPFHISKPSSPRKEFLYWTDDGDIAALRHGNWKIVFLEQRAHGFDVWQEPFIALRFPKLFNLRTDPFERADHEGMGYGQWRAERMFALAPAQAFVAAGAIYLVRMDAVANVVAHVVSAIVAVVVA